jgi:hypothetical protein
MYFIELVGMSLGGEDLPIAADAFGNSGTNLDVGTAFTLLLLPGAYTPLRDAFRKEMSQYNRSVPGFAGFDTCYNFTGLPSLWIPAIQLNFGNGESLLIDGNQMMYYDDDAAPFTVACLAFTALDTGDDGEVFSVIGSYTLASTEVVYDVAGGKVGFIPGSC